MACLEETNAEPLQGDLLLPNMTDAQRIQRLEAIVMKLDSRIYDLSQALAEKEHGADAVANAITLASSQPGLMETFANTPHPFDELMQWFKRDAIQ